MEHILIVDGSNLLFQMFYGMPARIVNQAGRPIQGTLGFVGALLKIIRRVEPTRVAVVFDGEHPNPRCELDEHYKANREDLSALPEEDTPFSQLPDIYAALDWLGICHRETVDCEADDWIAGYALSLGQTHRMTIVSQDSDFFQLITDRVHILRYRGDRTLICDGEHIRHTFGIEPGQYADFKSLTGDTADHIRGADKVGPKTAAALLRQFGTLEAALAGVDEVKKPSIRASLRQNADRLRLNQRLIRLQAGAALPFTLEEMTFRDTGASTTQVLRAIGVK